MLKRSDAGMLFYPVTYAGMLLYLLLNWVSDIHILFYILNIQKHV